MIKPMIPRGHSRLAFGLAALWATASLSPPAIRAAVSLAGGELHFDTSLRATHDSNIRGTSVAVDDTVFTLRPALNFDRSGGQSSLNVGVGMNIQRFQDFDEFDDENVFANLNFRMPRGARTSANIRADYFAGDQINNFLNDRVDTTRLNFRGNVSYRPGGRLSFRLGGYLTDRKIVGFNKSSGQTIRLGMGMRVRPDVTGFADVSFGQSKSSRVTTTGFVSDRSHRSFSVGLDGELTPRLTGSVAVGYRKSSAGSADTGGDSDRTIASAELTWEPRATTSITVEVRSDPYVTGDGRSVEIYELDVDLTQRLGPRFRLSGGVRWRDYKYIGATNSNNDHVGAELQLIYNPNQRFGGGLAFTTFTRYADNPVRDFDRNTFSVFGSVRF